MIHDKYARLNKKGVKVVDEAFKAVANTFVKHGFNAFGDDTAERLVEAIAVYLVVSNGGRGLAREVPQ